MRYILHLSHRIYPDTVGARRRTNLFTFAIGELLVPSDGIEPPLSEGVDLPLYL